MSQNEPETFFPELEGNKRREADEWLRDYLRLIMRLERSLREQNESTGHPQDPA